MKVLKYLSAGIGRLFFSIFFIFAAVKKVTSWSEVKHQIQAMLTTWGHHSPAGVLAWFVELVGNYITFFLVIAIIIEFLGALMILIGYKPRIGAAILFIFLAPVTVFMHPFWLYAPSLGEVQFVMFFKNLTIIGALFFIMAYDNGYFGKKHCCDDEIQDEDESDSFQSNHHEFHSPFREEEGPFQSGHSPFSEDN